MKEFARRRGLAGLAIAFLTAAALSPLPAAPGRAQGANPDSTPRSLAGRVLPPSSGSSTPEPVRVFTDARGRTCRVYERNVMIEGAPSTALATICRESSGRWVLSR